MVLLSAGGSGPDARLNEVEPGAAPTASPPTFFLREIFPPCLFLTN
jgi:hypothetical protein